MKDIKLQEKAFGISLAKGFKITFENGYTISTQFGYGNYCSNHNTIRDNVVLSDHDRTAETRCDSNNVEIGVWDKNGKWVTKRAYKAITGKKLCDDVHGWVNVTDWKKYLDWTASRRKQK